MSLKALVCAVALWNLSSQIAEASFVQVVRPSPSGWGWIIVGGDLETPEPVSDPKGVIQNAPFDNPLAPIGFRIGRWENENFGPIYADVSFFKFHRTDLASSSNPIVAMPITDQSSSDNSVGGDVLGDWNSLSGSSGPFGSLDGTLSGYIPGSLSGEISGTTGGSVDIVLSGQLDTVSSVPLPDAEWLFATGLVGWIVLVNHRTWVRKLGRIK
jgi:hypothetical protein